jgi:hypothetical protein
MRNFPLASPRLDPRENLIGNPRGYGRALPGCGAAPFFVDRYCFLHNYCLHKMQAEGKRELPPRL